MNLFKIRWNRLDSTQAQTIATDANEEEINKLIEKFIKNLNKKDSTSNFIQFIKKQGFKCESAPIKIVDSYQKKLTQNRRRNKK